MNRHDTGASERMDGLTNRYACTMHSGTSTITLPLWPQFMPYVQRAKPSHHNTLGYTCDGCQTCAFSAAIRKSAQLLNCTSFPRLFAGLFVCCLSTLAACAVVSTAVYMNFIWISISGKSLLPAKGTVFDSWFIIFFSYHQCFFPEPDIWT